MDQYSGILAIDVGSSCVKLGWFPSAAACDSATKGELQIVAARAPVPDLTLRLEHAGHSDEGWLAPLDGWLDELPDPASIDCLLGVVHVGAADVLERALSDKSWRTLRRASRNELSLQVDVEEPERVGIDRLFGAVAAKRLRSKGSVAITVDMGTATTINRVSSGGVFEGGAIIAGTTAALAALHAATTTLPLLGSRDLAAPPDVLGKSTAQAMAAGAYWGAAGAISEIVRRLTADVGSPVEVFVTGGAAAAFRPALESSPARPQFVPHLVLSGIALTALSDPKR